MGNWVILTEVQPESGRGNPSNGHLKPHMVGASPPNMPHGMCVKVEQLCWGSMIHLGGRKHPKPASSVVDTVHLNQCCILPDFWSFT